MDEGYIKAGGAGWMRDTIKLGMLGGLGIQKSWGCWVDEVHNKAGGAGWMRDTIKLGMLGG